MALFCNIQEVFVLKKCRKSNNSSRMATIICQDSKELENPACSPAGFSRMIQQYKETQLLFAGINLKVFSYLRDYEPANRIAVETGYDERNLALFLNSLAAIGLLEKNGDTYRNTPESELFLNQDSPLYLGEYLTFWNRMTSLEHVEERVRTGPDTAVRQHNQGAKVYEFRELARLSATEMYTGRVQSFLQAVIPLFNQDEPVRILDLGGGSGVMSVEFIRRFTAASGVIFEQPTVADIPARLIHEHYLEQRLSIMQGDFTKDSIGSGYNLIIASGILDLASANLEAMTAKLAQVLMPSGYLYLGTFEVSDNYLSPKESIVGWLSSHLSGLNLMVTKQTIETALRAAGFEKVSSKPLQGMIQNLVGELYQITK